MTRKYGDGQGGSEVPNGSLDDLGFDSSGLYPARIIEFGRGAERNESELTRQINASVLQLLNIYYILGVAKHIKALLLFIDHIDWVNPVALDKF